MISSINCSNLRRIGSFNVLKYYLFSNVSKTYKNKQRTSQQILKEYFSCRLTTSSSQLKNYLYLLSKKSDIKIKDHRWQNLYMTIEKFHKDFDLTSKIQLIQCLGKIKQNNGLYLTLYKSIVSEFHKLNLNQISIFLWSMIRVKQNDKNIVLAIYKRLYKVLQNNQPIKICKMNENSQNIIYKKQINQKEDQNDQSQDKSQIKLTQSNFTLLIWSLQKTQIIDEKLILNLLKFVLQNEQYNNLQKIRIENLCLLLHCMTEIKFQKYRITQNIIDQIMNKQKQLQNISVLSLVVLLQSFKKCIKKYQQIISKNNDPNQNEKNQNKQLNIIKQRNFCILITQTILQRHQKSNKKSKFNQKRKTHQTEEYQIPKLQIPLSPKFASQIIFHLSNLNIYQKQIYYKVISCLTDNIDQTQIQDLSMCLAGICYLNLREIQPKQRQEIIYNSKKIICKRIFQIYTSIKGKSLNVIKDLIHTKKIQNQLVPSRVRKQIQKEYQTFKIQNQKKQYSKKQQQHKNQK